ncbi:MAG: glutathione peroxidase [Hyphomicrobium sp.]
MLRSFILKLFSLTLLTSTAGSLTASGEQVGSAYDFSFTSIDGKPMPLSSWRGKTLLIVNTASFCGFTQQYKGLQKLYELYEPKGLIIVGVPSNDFGGQEPGTEGQIKEFCEGAFGITFPLTEKTIVSGDKAHPFYIWAVKTLGPKSAPGWNFHKYLIDGEGRLIKSFYSGTAPDSKELISDIENIMSKKDENKTN